MVMHKGNVRNTNQQQRFPHYSHTPFRVEDGKTSIAVDAKGKTKIVEDHEKDNEFSEVLVTVSLINLLNKIAPILKERKLTITMADTGVKLVQDNGDEFSEVNTSLDLIEKASTIIRSTRSMELKDEPYKDE